VTHGVPGTWDLHHHIVPPFYRQALRSAGIRKVGGFPVPRWSPQRSLRMMDRFSIEKAFLSVSSPGVWLSGRAQATRLARQVNEYAAAVRDDHPERFGVFASVSLPDVDAALSQLDQAFDELCLDGVVVMSNVNGVHLGDPTYRRFWQYLHDRRAVVYLHPNSRPGSEGNGLLDPLYLWQNDTTRSLFDFVRAGCHRDFAQVRFVVSHAGGLLPVLLEALVRTLAPERPHIREELAGWKSNLFLDTASKAFPEQLPAVLGFAGPGQVVFGSDFPFARSAAARTLVKAYTGAPEPGLSTAEVAGVFRENAVALFGSSPGTDDAAHAPPIRERPRPGSAATVGHTHLHFTPAQVLLALDPAAEPGPDHERALGALQESGQAQGWVTLAEPRLWRQPPDRVQQLLHLYNDGVAALVAAHPGTFQAYGAIDVDQPAFSLDEIDRCLGELGLHGIELSVDMTHYAGPDTFVPESLLRRLGRLTVPVLLHPQNADRAPLLDGNDLDTVMLVAKSFHLGLFQRHLSTSELVVTHTDGVLPYLTGPFDLLYYLPALRPGPLLRYLVDHYVRGRARGREALARLKVD
jgi:6-methylsalicylate decarboxylase